MKTNSGKKRVLIVNRGEIAIRIAKALWELGHVPIGLWTENEESPAHFEYCQEWIKLEGASNLETFLNISQILNIIKNHNIDAVHPGYGFLSENIEFSKELEKQNITFIGPHAEAVRVMGDKAISKSKVAAEGLPTVPGSKGEISSVAEALKVADDIGYPVLLKAVAGGGGKGMRRCNSAKEVESFFESVQREALSSFGNQALLVEKFIVNPRHIEVQILADKKGNIFHLFERECSIQRRHQKILEEAPSPFIGEDEELRDEICQTAVKIAKAVDYDSAGTVEFIMGEDRKFYFLEMNTRIQVEHPITEEITGIDLLVAMIQIAFEEPLDFSSQEDIKLLGHAIECRICAEDSYTMLPHPGKLTAFETSFPQGTRFDHCLYVGLEVTADFDPMIGKLITFGISRAAAIRKMQKALEGLHLEGLKTNLPLQKVILDDPTFISGAYSTNYITECSPTEKLQSEVDIQNISAKLALLEARQYGNINMRYYLINNELGNKTIDVTSIKKHSEFLWQFLCVWSEETKILSERNIFIRKLAGKYFYSEDQKSWKRLAWQKLPEKILSHANIYKLFRGYRPSQAKAGDTGGLSIKMPGKVVKVLVQEGQEVKKGDTLLILEAMKMENEFKCHVDGFVKSIFVKENQVVEEGVVSMEIVDRL